MAHRGLHPHRHRGSERGRLPGGNRLIGKDRPVATTRMNTYIVLMIERYEDGNVSTAMFTTSFSHTPVGDSLHRDRETAPMSQRPQASNEVLKRYGALLYSSLLDAVKYRPQLAGVVPTLAKELPHLPLGRPVPISPSIIGLPRARKAPPSFVVQMTLIK